MFNGFYIFFWVTYLTLVSRYRKLGPHIGNYKEQNITFQVMHSGYPILQYCISKIHSVLSTNLSKLCELWKFSNFYLLMVGNTWQLVRYVLYINVFLHKHDNGHVKTETGWKQFTGKCLYMCTTYYPRILFYMCIFFRCFEPLICWALWGVIDQDLRIMELALETLHLLLLLLLLLFKCSDLVIVLASCAWYCASCMLYEL